MDDLTIIELEELTEHENIIEHGLKTFAEVGQSLQVIRDKKLYRQKFDTFENYCRERWSISRPRAYQLMDAATINKNLSTIVDKLPTTESQARELTSLEPEEQIRVWEQVIDSAKDGKITAAIIRTVRDINRKKIEDRRQDRIESTPIIPNGKYNVIYADPPWKYDYGFDIHGAADRHYSTMTINELCNLPIIELAEDNAVLFLWVTSPKLFDSLEIINSWGFVYKTSFIWDKIKHVMGHYNSVRHELLLICTRGSFPKQSNTLHDSVISIERTNSHSEKPGYFRQLIEEMYPKSKKIELFARGAHDGWDSWGNEL